MKHLLTLTTLFLVTAGSFANEIIIPPISQCQAIDVKGKLYIGNYGGSSGDECQLFGEDENRGCDKVVSAINNAIELCQKRGQGICKITRCWENPQ